CPSMKLVKCKGKTLGNNNQDFSTPSWLLIGLEVPLPAFFKKAVYFHLTHRFTTMFAIVSIAGQQFKVEEGQQIFVHRLAANEGDAVSFDAVHLIDKDGKVTIGVPNIKGAQVSASVLGHLKGDKVIVFKKKRRKGYRKKNGHRQQFSKIKIESIKG
ncbi:MAG: 50S ribosomal protein L21, partial [Saprospiraceae bacterium]